MSVKNLMSVILELIWTVYRRFTCVTVSNRGEVFGGEDKSSLPRLQCGKNSKIVVQKGNGIVSNVYQHNVLPVCTGNDL
jgi:hypothetical protein